MQDKHQLGLQKFKEGNWAEAVRLLGHALGEAESSECWNDWAAAQFASGNSSDAEEGFRRALEVDPGNLQAAGNLGALLSESRPHEAFPFLELARSSVPEDNRALVDALRERCRPAWNLESIRRKDDEALLRPFADDDQNARSYYETHLQRYLTTLALLPPAIPGQKLLELGASFHHLSPVLRKKGYDVRCTDIWEGEKQYVGKVPSSDNSEDLTFVVDNFDLQHTPWPYADHLFDVVLCSEIIEHLSHDPIAVLAEINRVLKARGLLLLTTPNIASAKSVLHLLRGDSPYVFGQFFRDGLATDRHNREYTAGEVRRLAQAAGFEVLHLSTQDSWWRDQRTALRHLAAMGLTISLRGDNTFLLARQQSPVIERYPSEFYSDMGSQAQRRQQQSSVFPAQTRPIPAASAAQTRVLVVHEVLPHFDRTGSDARLMQVLNSLLKHNCALTFIGRNGMNCDAYSPALRDLGINVYSGSIERQGWLSSDHPLTPSLPEILSDGKFDIALLCHWFWVGLSIPEQYLSDIRRLSPQTRIAILSDDRHGEREMRLARLTGLLSDYERACDYEQRECELYPQADLLLAISDDDRRGMLGHDPFLQIDLLPMVAEPGPPGPAYEQRNNILFLANFENAANCDALQWFVENIWPDLRRRLPELQLSLVGNHVPGTYSSQPGIAVRGYLPELAPCLGEHRVFISPLRVGTGIKTKNLIALSHGLPLVTTSVGAEGMALTHGQHALIADTREDFLAAIIRLYTDSALWQQLAEAGRAHILERFSQQALDRQVALVLQKLRTLESKPAADEICSFRRVERSHPNLLKLGVGRPAIAERARAYIEQGRKLLAEGHANAAREQLRHMFTFVREPLPRDLVFDSAYSCLAECYRRLGEPEMAERWEKQLAIPAHPLSSKVREKPAPVRTRSRTGNPALALSMIVRNAAADLPVCLESVRHLVQEIIIADTGSTDDTFDVARQLGAQVISIPWQENFADARNLALEPVQSDWVLVLDADEELDPSAADLLPALLKRPDVSGYRIPLRHYCRNVHARGWDRRAQRNTSTLPRASAYPAYVEKEIVRLFRRDPDIRFIGRVHENVDLSILRRGGKIGDANFCIHHYGFTGDQSKLAEKNQWYLKMGRLKIQEMPDSALAHIEVGLLELDTFGRPQEALQCFQRACELEPQNATAWLFAGMSHIQLGDDVQALGCLEKAERHCGLSPMISEARGDANFNLGNFESAARSFRRAWKASESDANLESKLGLAELRLGEVQTGLARMRRALQREPDRAQLHDRLITAYISVGQLNQAAQAAERKLEQTTPSPEGFLRAAAIHFQLRAHDRSHALLVRALQLFPHSDRLANALHQIESNVTQVADGR